MLLQGGCVMNDGGRAMGKRGGSSKMVSYIPKKIRKQIDSSLLKGN